MITKTNNQRLPPQRDPAKAVTMINIQYLLLLAVILVAAFLRLYRLDSVPPAPYWEETALGYDAYSILKTGKDFHGNPFPMLAFPSFGDYKPSGYFYAVVPFVKLFGLNIWSVRLPSAIAGIICVGVLYLIGKELWDTRVGLIAAALFAVSPWSLQFSRGGWEVNLAVMLLAVGCWLLIVSYRKVWLLPLSVMFFGLSMYTYHAARVFAPVFGGVGGILLITSWWKLGFKKKHFFFLFISVLLAFSFLLPFVLNLKSSQVSSRFDATSIFSDPGPVLASNAAVAAHGNTKIVRIIFHRYWFYGQLIFINFAKHFSPDFLFVRGDGNLRHSTVRFGLLYPVDAIFILIALRDFYLKKDKKSLILIFSILLAGVAPSLVFPAPHALRFLFAAPGFVLLTAYGISRVKQQKWIAFIYVLFIASYLAFYFGGYRVKAASDWQYGYKEMYVSLSKYKLPGESVYVTREQGRPSMYYLFYSQYDPAKLQQQEPSLPKDQLELLRVDDYYFVDGLPQGKGLFATSETKVDPKAMVLEKIKRPDGTIVWVIWRK